MTNTTTPTGEAGIRLTCTDPTHRHVGAAIIRHTDDPIHQDTACKLIDLARHPVLSRAASVQRFGPWPDPDCDDCAKPMSEHCTECSECPLTPEGCWCTTEADPLLAV